MLILYVLGHTQMHMDSHAPSRMDLLDPDAVRLAHVGIVVWYALLVMKG